VAVLIVGHKQSDSIDGRQRRIQLSTPCSQTCRITKMVHKMSAPEPNML
jgi:hypothetical protein